MKDYVSEFKRKIDEIRTDCQNINILNAGIMDHGKSSLFNSLIDKEFFKTGDIRTTTEIGKVQWRDNVYLLDTPGLEAEKTDDKTAHDAYRRANLIIFVHTLAVGELHEKELAAINKIKSYFNDDDFFCKHFCLALTFKESEDDEKISSIRSKTLEDIKNHCGISGFPVFVVSNLSYQKGVAENQQQLIEYSGILELREFLQNNFQTWNNENAYFRDMRIANVKNELIPKLQQERADLQRSIDSKTEDIKWRQQNYLQRVQAAVNQRRSEQREAEEFKKDKQWKLDSLHNEGERLSEAADRAADRYFNSGR